MALSAVHDTLEEIPEAFRELYTEKGDKWEFTAIPGLKTQADITRVQEAHRKTTNDLKDAREKFRPWAEVDYEETMAKLDRIPELEAAAKGKLDEAAIDEIVERRVQGTIGSQMAPLERSNKELQAANVQLTEANTTYQTTDRKRRIGDVVREQLTTQKVRPEAHQDAMLYMGMVMEIREDDGAIVTREGLDGISQGLTAEQLLVDLQASRPHWWLESRGTGSRGASGSVGAIGGKNPWHTDHWNLTAQGRYVTEHGGEKAQKAAQAVGSYLGATKPVPKKG